jgi:molybdopterin-guanine dinucleotide biosynthesis protein A
MKILIITEQREGKWNKVSFETLAAAQQIARQAKGSLSGVVIGKNMAALADELETALRAGMRKIDAWTARYGVAEAAFDDAAGDPFFNVNRPEELAEAERRLAEV